MDLASATLVAGLLTALPAWAAYLHSRRTNRHLGHPNGYKTLVAMVEDVLAKQGRIEEQISAHLQDRNLHND